MKYRNDLSTSETYWKNKVFHKKYTQVHIYTDTQNMSAHRYILNLKTPLWTEFQAMKLGLESCTEFGDS